MQKKIRIPVINASVRDKRQDRKNALSNQIEIRPGRVTNCSHNDQLDYMVNIRFSKNEQQSIPLQYMGNGLVKGHTVYEEPEIKSQKSLGLGTVLQTRMFGGEEQVLVEFPEKGKICWLPFHRLRRERDTKYLFIKGQQNSIDHNNERFRLKTLAYALEMWNENTGALSDLEIDPLPHQIHLVHSILASGHLNWLIADDVGLGKTIEVGMLLSALNHRGQAKRILLVTPAGLTKQWQEELNTKFNLNNFQIYGHDFNINYANHWKLYDHVIASIDKLKDEESLQMLQQAGQWDLIVFDEAHRLSRRQYGTKYDPSGRFKLAQHLRKFTDSILLLTATPHQGMQDKFKALLELIHPERKTDILTLENNPEIISEMMFRNNKSDVTDVHGNFIFKGKTVHSIATDITENFKQFDLKLRDYFKNGYELLNHSDHPLTKINAHAIGFVMTTYRKLASSSLAAIHTALKKRLNRLKQRNITLDDYFIDERFSGENEEYELIEAFQKVPDEFFNGEIQLIEELLEMSAKLLKQDKKFEACLEKIIKPIKHHNQHEKVLIFTEYTMTQSYLKDNLAKVYGEKKIGLINGSMKHIERQHIIEDFQNGEIDFLISTEAGGEGINLQKNCHIMINYDLPWNPMRLVQRIGRLYRYGQQKKVIIFNLHSPNTADDLVLDIIYERLEQVVQDLSPSISEFNQSLSTEILGELTNVLDISDILKNNISSNITKTKQQINQALENAKNAVSKQREIFEYAAKHNPQNREKQLHLSKEHWSSFILGMCNLLNINVEKSTHKDVWNIKLPPEILKEFGGKRINFKITVNRNQITKFKDIQMMDLDNPLMQFLLKKAKSQNFGGNNAIIKGYDNQYIAYSTAILRWQNSQGKRRMQELVIFGINEQLQVEINPQSFNQWLKNPAQYTSRESQNNIEVKQKIFHIFETAAQQYLAQKSSNYLYPENNQWLSAAVVI